MNKQSNGAAKGWLRHLGATASLAVLAIAAASGATGGDARSLMAQVYQQDRNRDVSIRANFDRFDPQGQVLKKQFTYRRKSLADSRKALVTFTDPVEIRGVALLSLTAVGEPNRQYIYIPATHRVREVATQQRSASFVGTDFTFEDIEDRNIDDFNYRLLGDQELMDGHKTYKVEATPANATVSQYKFLRFWLAQDVPVILLAEMYDTQGALVRVLHASGLKKISGIWGARRIEMRTVQSGTRTVLTVEDARFDRKLDEKLFTPEALEASSL